MTGKIQISIAFEDVTLRVGGKWVLKGINWRIGPDQHWVIQGPNGAGKTTLARALLGQGAVVKGLIRRFGGAKNISQAPAMAMVSPEQVHQLHQREQLLAEMRHFSGRVDETTTGRQVLGGAGALAGKGVAQGPGLKSYASLFGLDRLLDKPVEALSSGEMRKLLLARALGADPQLLILDEPFNNLDAASRADLGAMLGDLMAMGVQLILITHHLGEVPPGFTHVLHLAKGKVTAQGRLPGRSHLAPAEPEPVVVDSGRPQSPPRQASPPLVELRDVCVRYNATLVLDHVRWTVNPGEHWALIGPNGAGKSTLLRLITGDQLQGYANQVYLFGRRKGSGESVWQIKRQIGLVSDELHARYQKKVDARDVISSGFFDSVGLYRRCTAEQKQIVGQWLGTLDLEALARERFDRLSFGQQRLILIARAMVKQPRLLILDEPCSGLDPAHRRKVLALVEALGRRGATQLIYVTHRPEELPACITHKLFLEAGKVMSQDPFNGR